MIAMRIEVMFRVRFAVFYSTNLVHSSSMMESTPLFSREMRAAPSRNEKRERDRHVACPHTIYNAGVAWLFCMGYSALIGPRSQ